MVVLRHEDGAALITALMLTTLALVITMALLYTVTVGTRISASQKRYRSALAAANGGVELFTQEIIPRLLQPDTTEVKAQSDFARDFALINLQMPQYGCLQQKLNTPTSKWSACSAAQSSADPSESPDVTFKLSGATNEKGFTVSTKVVDTVPGNTDRSGINYLDPGTSVSGNGSETIHPQHVPSIYSLSVQGVREGSGAREKARLSVLYAY
jgi:Tfp pilus assembly protein PilX